MRFWYSRDMSSALPKAVSRPPPFDVAALAAGHSAAALADPSGACEVIPATEAAQRLDAGLEPVVCHLPATARRLRRDSLAGLDVLELFAFARPAEPCRPSPAGLAEALDLAPAPDFAGEARLLQLAAGELLADLAGYGPEERRKAAGAAHMMALNGWRWAPYVLRALNAEEPDILGGSPLEALEVWRALPEWSETAPAAAAGNHAVSPADARGRLAELVGPGAEDRPQQADYASAVSHAFVPRSREDHPQAVLAEAGTGTGKTLGYLAPASLWAERNDGTVWISTYTRNLQRQIDHELDRLHADPAEKARRVVVRKGRENYLCLLNYEEALNAVSGRSANAVGLALVARWAAASRSGEIPGGDFPGWLVDLAGRRWTTDLADRRGECIYAACRHYHRCYIEKTARRSRRADIVIANHALVLTQAAAGAAEDGQSPTRLVFDEGHHLFDAADSTFATCLGGRDCAELRHWLIGAEGSRRSRARGVEGRIGDLQVLDEAIPGLIGEIRAAALALPGPNWMARIREGPGQGAAEHFLHRVREQVYARAADSGSWYDIETDIIDPLPELVEAAQEFGPAIGRLASPMKALSESLSSLLDREARQLDTVLRNRIESIARALAVRVEDQLAVWQSMLNSLTDETPEEFVEWFCVRRFQRDDVDVAMHRHWIDPMEPFASRVLEAAHGVVVTSATLREGSGDVEADWLRAEERAGMSRLGAPPLRAQVASPFDYESRTRVFVVTDVDRNDRRQVAAAYRELFLAAGGGALGLFTAVARLRAVHELIVQEMEAAGYPLLAQHVDGLDAASLVDIFRAEERSCLLGTDAMRDGVDVPGRSLRLIVFERVPWPVPTILHRARRAAFGGARYDDLIVRLRLKQAFGRLVRGEGDSGVFVLLDPRLAARFAGAFPDGVEIRRIGLADALAETRRFLEAGRDA